MKRIFDLLMAVALCAGLGTGVLHCALAKDVDTTAVNMAPSEGFERAARHTVTFTRLPNHVPTSSMVDGPILGNGDLGVVIGGPGAEQIFYLGKNDFWSINQAMLMRVGAVRVRIPALADATYRQEQDMAHAEVRGAFTKDSTKIQTRSWVSATENLLVTELANVGSDAVKVTVDQNSGSTRSRKDKDKKGKEAMEQDHAKPLPINDIPGWMGDPSLLIGCNTEKEPGLFFDGIIDDMRIYERKLGEKEIQAAMAGRAPRRGLLLSWPEGSGAETLVESATAVAGKVGQTVRFDGRKSFVHCGLVRGSSEAVTVSAWVNAASLAPKGNSIIAKHMAYSLELQDGHVCMTILSAGENVARTHPNWAQTTERLAINEWHHLAGVYDGYGIAIYVDGVKAKTTENYTPELKARIKPSSEETASTVGTVSPLPDEPASDPRIKTSSVDIASAICVSTRVADRMDKGKGRSVTFATRVLAETVGGGDKNSLAFDLKPGKTARIVTVVLSDLDNPDHPAAAQARLPGLDGPGIERLNSEHRAWWARYWSKSFIEIPDQRIEQFWYGSLYILGSCSREGKVAPGLWGNWISDEPMSYRGDFTLNYNFQAPYYIAYASNHPEVTHPFYQAIGESLPNGQQMARNKGWKGVHFPAHIGPWGLRPEGWNDFGQRSDAAYAALNFIWYYQYTQDLEWLKKTGYPYLSEVAAFWEDYLKFEDGRYVIHKDAIHEGSGDEVNNLLSLGLVRTLFKSMLEFSAALDVDAARRTQWQHILDHLSKFPLQQRNGQTVFRYTERGLDWFIVGTLGIQHVFPAGAIGLDSDPKLIEISKNMVRQLGRWNDYNGFSSIYTAAARVGYDPHEILRQLRNTMQKSGQVNLTMQYCGGGIENGGGLLAINEMLFQSHEGVLRFFPCWPREQNARFGDLRAYGAFLVSAEFKDGKVGGVRILSEKGKACTVQNPWPGSKVQIVRNGKLAETVSGERFTLKTQIGEGCELHPVQN